MRTVTFKTVLHGSARMLGLDPARDLSPARAAVMAEAINLRVAEGWKREFWPEWTVSEQRYYRGTWNSTDTFAAPSATAAVEVYHLRSGKYFQTLRSTLNQEPEDADAVINYAYWYPCQGAYEGIDWATGQVLVAGDVRRLTTDGRFYACHTAHTTGASFDTTKFGVLTPFAKTVAYEQTGQTALAEVKFCSRRDPRVNTSNPWKEAFTPVAAGILLGSGAPNIIWVTFRLRPPVFTSSVYSSTTAYVAGDLVYYATTGECYRNILAGTGFVPTNATYWVKVDFPAVLEDFVKRAVYADQLRELKQQQRAAMEEDRAYEALNEAADVALEQQEQYARAAAQTYR